MYLAAKRAQILPQEPSLRFCYDMLNRVSRSFAVVIQQRQVRGRHAIEPRGRTHVHRVDRLSQVERFDLAPLLHAVQPLPLETRFHAP